MESFGPIYAEALTILSELGHRMSVVTGDMHEKTFLFNVYPQPFNVLTELYLKVLSLTTKFNL